MAKQLDILSQIVEFLGRYLRCSEHQRTVLALWVLHTYCSSAAQVTPYLSIRSACKQSGKTLCLQLLSLLCEDSVLTAGFTASKLAQHLKRKPAFAVLLDESHATVGTHLRAKAPGLRALLASSFHRSPCGAANLSGELLSTPKAFAGMGRLPEELADRSIPIILEPLGVPAFLEFDHDAQKVPESHSPQPATERVTQPASGAHQRVERFHLRRATQQAQPLKRLLHAWTEENLPKLLELPLYNEDQFPPGLSPRRQDICEPLLQLADALGGEWPARGRQALITLFQQEEIFDLQPSLQLLSDLHACFVYHGFPQRLSTNCFLDWVQTLPARPWDVDGPLTAYKLARLLTPFAIRPRLQRIDEANPARGYQLHDFLEPWRRHLGSSSPAWAAPDQNKDWPARLEEFEIAAKNKGCNGVSRVESPVSAEAFSTNGSSISTEPANSCEAALLPLGLSSDNPSLSSMETCKGEGNRQPEDPIARSRSSKITNNDAVCNGVSRVEELPISAPTLSDLVCSEQGREPSVVLAAG